MLPIERERQAKCLLTPMMSFSRFPRTLSCASRSLSRSSTRPMFIGEALTEGLPDDDLLIGCEDADDREEATEDGRLPCFCCCLLVGRFVVPLLTRPRIRVPPMPERFSCSRSPGTVV